MRVRGVGTFPTSMGSHRLLGGGSLCFFYQAAFWDTDSGWVGGVRVSGRGGGLPAPVRRFADAFLALDSPLHLLVNNAGVVNTSYRERCVSKGGWVGKGGGWQVF